MPHPFNFYEYAGTGDGQFIAPFVTFFTGFYFPPSLSQGIDIGFIWRLTDDDSVWPSSYSTLLTGTYHQGQNDTPTLQLTISGNVTPLIKESGSYSVNVSGRYTSGQNEVGTFYNQFTGRVSQGSYDSFGMSGHFTGKIPLQSPDIAKFTSSFTGINHSGIIDAPKFLVGFTGSVNKNKKDTATLSLTLNQATYAAGTSKVVIFNGDSGNMTLSFVSAIYQSA